METEGRSQSISDVVEPKNVTDGEMIEEETLKSQSAGGGGSSIEVVSLGQQAIADNGYLGCVGKSEEQDSLSESGQNIENSKKENDLKAASADKLTEGEISVPLMDDSNILEPVLTPIGVRVEDDEIDEGLPISESNEADNPSVIELFDDDDLPQSDCEISHTVGNAEKIDKESNIKKIIEVDVKQNLDPNLKMEVDCVAKDIKMDVDKDYIVFFGKECINYECKHKNINFIKAPLFILNFYKIPRKSNKTQYVCDICYETAVAKYEEFCSSLIDKQPLLYQDIPKRHDFVEILDSDEEEGAQELNAQAESEFDQESLDLLQKELDNTICQILSKVEIENQVSWTQTILKSKLKVLEEQSEDISTSLRNLQKSADRMHNSLYQCPKIKIKQLQSLDLNTGRPFLTEIDNTIPPAGEISYPSIEVNGLYYAVKNKAIASWLPCRVVELMDVVISGQKAVKYFKIKFVRIKMPTIKCVSAKHMAYGDPPKYRLNIGTRVIALFDGSTLLRAKDKAQVNPARNAFYPGIIAEPLQTYNKYRYLIFFDDGYAQYVQHKDIRIVCQAAENVWEDVHPASREFIHNYLTQYQKHRPMVQVKKGQSMITESNGKWLYAKVVDLDASLVQMHFDEQNRSEWIYRGSTRLGPLFREKQTKGALVTSQIPRRSEPYVRYMQDEENKIDNQQSAADKQSIRAVAKKSVTRSDSQPAAPVKHLNNSTIFLEDDNRPKGKVVYYTAKKNMPPKQFIPHDCSPKCLFPIMHNLSSYSPLAKPLLSGWERQIFKSKLKKSVVYRAPCGRRIRNMDELHKYIRLTNNVLNVDNFDFDCLIHCLAEYVIESSIVQKADISDGLEHMIIPCINYYDNSMPPTCVYSTQRIPTEGVNLNLSSEFMVGCDCEDDCTDKTKCSCWQLTLAGARFGNPNTPPENVGYSYKRLPEPVPTGIYECNANCKCSKSCVNRVVQHPLQMKLQVFKTSNRGWGLRCLNDVPKGSFICIYAGHLLTEQNANEGGANSGDEYFAELDYIEVVERLKEGYESDVQEDGESEEELEEQNGENDSDEDFRSSASFSKEGSINTRLRARRGTKDYSDSKKSSENEEENTDTSKAKKNTEGDEDEDVVKGSDCQERQVINFEPNTCLEHDETSNNAKYKSIRKYFGKNEYCYVMDAKKTGNIGRYFNHSCSPNLFVQNVFVDTHDLRFPWVAFFALSHIRAGTELTWNYNYEVGIVPGKVLYCECGAPNCRGRLL